jgi:hypothetical protein
MVRAVRSELAPLRALHRQTVLRSFRHFLFGAVTLAIFAAILVARHGTVAARSGALVAAVLALGLAMSFLWRRTRDLKTDSALLRRVVGPADANAMGRAERALSLLEPDGSPSSPSSPTSPSRELGELHVARTLANLPMVEIERSQHVRRRSFRYGAVCVFALAFGTCASSPFAMLEGLLVLLARDGVAPFGIAYLANPTVSIQPPEYLHEPANRTGLDASERVSRGTIITVVGAPVYEGRRLLLTDGRREMPFVDDGSGKVVSRWPVTESASLRVAARFGAVVVLDPRELLVTSVLDEVPRVSLEGAPRTYPLEKGFPGGELPLRYEASDDHGLREVHLVLRSGGREERRQLAKLDGEVKRDRGGHVLRQNDPFLRKSHEPIEIRVEAKDNDPVSGPKWGVSEAFTLVPPDIGAPEAARMRALYSFRDALVDSLAVRIPKLPGSAPEREAVRTLLQASMQADAHALDELSATASPPVPARLQVLLRGQTQKVAKAWERLKQAQGAEEPRAHTVFVKASERYVLVVDAVLTGQGFRDAKASAKKLADVADDLALGANSAGSANASVRPELRTNAASAVLRGGEKSLFQLGSLGRDLGEIVEAALFRVDRALGKSDFFHAELAARDLAARLRVPDPSFGAKGGGGHGAESGSGQNAMSEGDGEGDSEGKGRGKGEGDEVAQAFNEAAHDLEKLAQEHAEQLSDTERALSTKPGVNDAAGTNGEQQKQTAEKNASLSKQGDKEQELAERARKIAENAKDVLPQATAEALSAAEQSATKAARALKQGDQEKARGHQRETQQHIEQALSGMGDAEGDDGKGNNTGDADGDSGGRGVPKADAHRGPEEWRRRVVKGLSLPGSQAQKDAIRRYAEGLVR